jgi:hypothetical protein
VRGHLLQAERGVRQVDSTFDRGLRSSLPGRASTLRQGHVLPEELALREPFHRPLQALRAVRGGVRPQVLRQADDSLLREGRLLPEEPLVLRDRQEAGVLSSAAEVRGSDPPGEHRDQARD